MVYSDALVEGWFLGLECVYKRRAISSTNLIESMSYVFISVICDRKCSMTFRAFFEKCEIRICGKIGQGLTSFRLVVKSINILMYLY